MLLKEKYTKEVIPALKKEFGYKNVMAIPRIRKVIVNTGVGRIVAAGKDEKVLDGIEKDLATICGQKLVKTKAKKAIAGFKLRQGSVVGMKCTLRRDRMYAFLERLVSLALPRTRDFRGLDKKSIDRGTMTIAVKEHIVFPEVVAERASQIFGFELSIVTTAKTAAETESLLRHLGFPIKK
jgi:large subunit ribosomal protein L5